MGDDGLDVPQGWWERSLTMKTFLAILLCFSFSCFVSPAFADTPTIVDAGAPDAGSAVAADPANGVVTPAVQPAPALDTVDGAKQAYTDIKSKYEALKKSGGDGSPKKLAFAAFLAIVLKYLLDAVNVVSRRGLKKQLAWVALGLAVPIALLSKYAGGTGWFEALVYAGSGPGAVVVHELIARFKKSK